MIYKFLRIFFYFVTLFSGIIISNLTYGDENFDPQIYKDIGVKGFFITEIFKDTPAEKSELKIGDELLFLNDYTISDDNSFNKVFERSNTDEFKFTIKRNYKTFDIFIKPEINNKGQKKFGFSYDVIPCVRDETISRYYKDHVFHKCLIDIDIERYDYLKKLTKSSKYYESYVFEKIAIMKRLGNNFSRNPLVFDLEKSKKLLKETYNLAKETKGEISNKSLYYYKTFEAEPANILYRQALVNLYLTEPGNVGLLPKYDLFLDKLDPNEGLKILHYLADQNHTVALHELGKIYLEGIYVKKDFNKAFYYFTKSNSFGRNIVNLDIADFYILGIARKNKNYKRSITHLKLGYTAPLYVGPKNYFDLGVLYKYKRIPKNKEEYYSWLVKELFNYKSRLSLIRIADYSRYYLNDYEKAYFWYYICSNIKLENDNWDKINVPMKEWWKENYIDECSNNILFLKSNILSPEKINSINLRADNWIKTKIK